MSAAQNVILEKSNVRIETAHVEQVRLEVEAARITKELADLTETNASLRLLRYKEFEEEANDLAREGIAIAPFRGILDAAL